MIADWFRDLTLAWCFHPDRLPDATGACSDLVGQNYWDYKHTFCEKKNPIPGMNTTSSGLLFFTHPVN